MGGRWRGWLRGPVAQERTMIMCLPKLECKGRPYLPLPRTVQEVKAWCSLCEGPVSALAGCVLPAGLGTLPPSQSPRPTPACLFPRGERRWLLVQSWPDARDSNERSFPVASDVPASLLVPTSKCRKTQEMGTHVLPWQESSLLSLRPTLFHLCGLFFSYFTEFTIFGSQNCAAVCFKTLVLLWWQNLVQSFFLPKHPAFLLTYFPFSVSFVLNDLLSGMGQWCL